MGLFKEKENKIEIDNGFIITTLDINKPYKILGPVFYQTANKGVLGGTYDELRWKYSEALENAKNEGLITQEWYGHYIESDYDKAFYIARQEIVKRAKILGADAIVGLRFDLDLDSNGYANFSLQMYGTAIKLE